MRTYEVVPVDPGTSWAVAVDVEEPDRFHGIARDDPRVISVHRTQEVAQLAAKEAPMAERAAGAGPVDRAWIEEIRRDPYTAALTRMWADAWAEGYQAGHGEGMRHATINAPPPSRSELVGKAYRVLADSCQRAEREAVLTLAALGPLVDRSNQTGRDENYPWSP